MAQLSQLLLFDPDPSGLETLSYVFQKDGCAVTATGDPAKARDLIQHAGAPLVLVALRAPEQVGLDLIHDITTNPRTRNLACVAIGRADLRAAAIGAGAFGFLSSPLFVRDVLDACKLVAAATVPGSRPSPDTEVSLKLTDLGGIYYLVRALAVTGRSAVAEIQRGQRRSELRFGDGILSSVQFGSVQGLPALHHLLLWEDADLRLKFKNVARRGGGSLSMKADEVIQECDRFLRDFAHEARELGVARTIYRHDPEHARPTASLPSEVVPVLRLFDGQRDLARVLEESPFRVFDTLKIVKQFAAAEAIKPTAPLPPGLKDSTALGGPAALDIWLQRPTGSVAADPAAAVASRRTPGVGVAIATSAGRATPALGVAVAAAASRRTPGVGVAIAAPRPAAVVVAAAPVEPVAVAAAEHVEANATTVTPPEPIAAVAAAPKPAGTVARGEIHVPSRADRPTEKKPVARPPSVMVEMETPPAVLVTPAPPPAALPVPRPLAPVAAAPISAQAPPPSVIVAPLTPPPVAITRARKPSATPARGSSPKNPRSPSNGFSAVEDDFFQREADLYKGEKAETFDDLDGGTPGQRPGPARKR